VKTRASHGAVAPPPASPYEDGFFVWTQQTAALLRARRFAEIDVEHAAEEIEDMGRRRAAPRRGLPARLALRRV
jgi:hypothetical protein